jgi:hypothetical protein
MSAPTTSGQRMRLHACQARVWQSPARFKVVAAGRRFGKTQMALVQLLHGCLSKPGLYRYVAPTAVLARKTLWRRKLKRALHPSWLSKKPNETNMEVWFRNGSILEVMGAEDPDGLRGEGVSGIVLDEYADMDEIAWSEAVRPSLADEKGWATFIGTPKSHNHFYNLWLQGFNTSTDYAAWQAWQFKSVDNPLLDPVEIEEARRTTDPRTFRQEWEASFEALAGRVYYAFQRATHVAPVTLDPALPVCLAFDFNIDPATCVIGQQQGQHVRVWREVRITHAGGEATKATALRAQQLVAEAGHRAAVWVYGDATGRAGKTTGPSDHQVLRDTFRGASWRIPSGQPHVRDRIAAVNSRCETATGERFLTVDPSCVGLVADLEQVTFADNGEIDKKSNAALTHLSDAFGYWMVREFPVVNRGPVAAAVWVEALL